MSEQQRLHGYFRRIQRLALITGGIGVAACLLGALTGVEVFLRAYLWAYLLWLGFALGCLALLLGHNMTGGAWGIVILRPLTAGARTLPLLAVLFVPIALGLPQLYAWATPEVAASDPIVQHRAVFQNSTFFIIRAVVYFVLWIGMARLATRFKEPGMRHSQFLSGLSLIVFTLSVTFAAVDWMMAIETHWFSTAFGVLVITGQVLGGLALAYVTLGLVDRQTPVTVELPRQFFRDLGHLLMTSVIAWAYILFAQFLILWAGNLPEDIGWAVHRLSGLWALVIAAVFLLNFIVPFASLISSRAKNRLAPLVTIAALILVGHLLGSFWMIAPSYYQTTLKLHWQDLATLAGIGGLWLALYVQDLKRKPEWSGNTLARAHQQTVQESREHAGADDA